MKKKAGILGATGMVGQRFITLLENHPWFEVTALAASPASAGKTYSEAVQGKWMMDAPIPESVKHMKVLAVEKDMPEIVKQVDFVFCALDMDKKDIKRLEEEYAAFVPVVSNNSAHRWTDDVPMIIPEVNPGHLELIHAQRKNRGWKKGFIVVKPNCSIQSYVIILNALKQFKPEKIEVTSLQAISGAGKTFTTWPEMVDNAIPFISGEEEKSEKEPLKIWGVLSGTNLELASTPDISATCIRVPVQDGHMASVAVSFNKHPSKEELISAVTTFQSPLDVLQLPSAPKKLIRYFEEDDRPQTNTDRNFENGMGITMGRLREGKFYDWKFIALSHNTIRGAAGGAVLTAELLVAKNFI